MHTVRFRPRRTHMKNDMYRTMYRMLTVVRIAPTTFRDANEAETALVQTFDPTAVQRIRMRSEKNARMQWLRDVDPAWIVGGVVVVNVVEFGWLDSYLNDSSSIDLGYFAWRKENPKASIDLYEPYGRILFGDWKRERCYRGRHAPGKAYHMVWAPNPSGPNGFAAIYNCDVYTIPGRVVALDSTWNARIAMLSRPGRASQQPDGSMLFIATGRI